MEKKEIIPLNGKELMKTSNIPNWLELIRPAWKSKGLIERVHKLLPIDPSSSCQRLFNAAIHDLREKIAIAGIDIAKEAARQYKLPPLEKAEDIEEYSTAKLLDLAYRIGLLSRPEWRKIIRCYEIRRDLEHEDDQYEAGIEDCLYIFKTCIEVILAKDPIQLLRVEDIKEAVEKPGPVFPSEALLKDYEHAPQPRQEEISMFLISVALDEKKSEVVRQNSYSLLTCLEQSTYPAVKIRLAEHMQQRIGRRGLDYSHCRVSYAIGILPYLKQEFLADFFNGILSQMEKVGYLWTKYKEHSVILRNFQEVGGLLYCPSSIRSKIINWLVRAYVGELSYGHPRPVFYSNTAAPIIEEIVKRDKEQVGKELRLIKPSKNPLLARRLSALLDLVDTEKTE